MKQKLLAVEVFGGIAFFVVLSALAYLAISEQSISVGNPRSAGVSYSSGTNAIWLGLGFLGFGLAALGYLSRYTKSKVLYWLLLTVVWLGFVAWQLTVGF